MDIKEYKKIAHSLVALFDPLAEVVIHDLSTGKIIFIQGNLSNRKVGDSSLFDTELDSHGEEELYQVTYPKINYDGRLIKSISIPIKNSGKLAAIMCINFDISIFQGLHQLTNDIIKINHRRPESLFKNDWQETIHQFLNSATKKRNKTVRNLSNKEKKEIIKELYENGAFEQKNAADYIARILDMGRATVFNYLRGWRKS